MIFDPILHFFRSLKASAAEEDFQRVVVPPWLATPRLLALRSNHEVDRNKEPPQVRSLEIQIFEIILEHFKKSDMHMVFWSCFRFFSGSSPFSVFEAPKVPFWRPESGR